MSSPEERWQKQLVRIERLIDVVFAVILIRVFLLLPKPGPAERDDMLDFVAANLGSIVIVLIGFLVVILQWLQLSAVFGLLRRTDTRHTVFVLVQLAALLLFLYAIRMGIAYDGDEFAMVFESATAALMGILGWVNWGYASKDRKLLHEWVTEQEVLKRSLKLIPEPVTALLTIPCAFLGPGVWALSWFVIAPAVAWVAKRRLECPAKVA